MSQIGSHGLSKNGGAPAFTDLRVIVDLSQQILVKRD